MIKISNAVCSAVSATAGLLVSVVQPALVVHFSRNVLMCVVQTSDVVRCIICCRCEAKVADYDVIVNKVKRLQDELALKVEIHTQVEAIPCIGLLCSVKTEPLLFL